MAVSRQYHYIAQRSAELKSNRLLLRRPTMKSLIINDLPRSEELDSAAMTAIQGGRNISPGIALQKLVSGPPLSTILDPIGPYGINGFVLPDGVAD
jgi:hypothetical protein